MNRTILVTASIFGVLAVILGAFAAHGLKETLTVSEISTFETGVRYQMYYALLLLFVGTTSLISNKSKKWIFYLTLIGILFFSGSIYGLATNNLTSFDFKTIAMITPIGGLLLIAVWGVLLFQFLKLKKS